jgi:hypothetical protein
MAQLVERQAVNLQVAGSSPAGGENLFCIESRKKFSNKSLQID